MATIGEQLQEFVAVSELLAIIAHVFFIGARISRVEHLVLEHFRAQETIQLGGKVIQRQTCKKESLFGLLDSDSRKTIPVRFTNGRLPSGDLRADPIVLCFEGKNILIVKQEAVRCVGPALADDGELGLHCAVNVCRLH